MVCAVRVKRRSFSLIHCGSSSTQICFAFRQRSLRINYSVGKLLPTVCMVICMRHMFLFCLASESQFSTSKLPARRRLTTTWQVEAVQPMEAFCEDEVYHCIVEGRNEKRSLCPMWANQHLSGRPESGLRHPSAISSTWTETPYQGAVCYGGQ